MADDPDDPILDGAAALADAARFRPLVVFGTGGSGTRLMQSILARGGYYMGHRLNHAGDATDFVELLGERIGPVLEGARALDYRAGDIEPELRRLVCRDIARRFAVFLGPMRGHAHIGFKNPRWIFLLPMLHAVFPHARAIHVVRNGHDIAMSGNQRQMRFYGRVLLGREGDGYGDRLLFWARVNAQAEAAGKALFGERYMAVRIEDLWAEDAATMRRVLDFARPPVDNIAYLLFGNRPKPPSPPLEPGGHGLPEAEAEEIAGFARRFGYL